MRLSPVVATSVASGAEERLKSLLHSVPRLLVLAGLLFVAGCRVQSAPGPTADTMSRAKVESQPVQGGPTLLRSGIALRKVLGVGGGNIKLARNPADGKIYFLHPTNGLFRLDPAPPGKADKVQAKKDIVADGDPAGMAFGPDGTLYVTVNKKVGAKQTQAIVRRGKPNASGAFDWQTVSSTEPYQLSGTNFDHLVNGITVSPDGKWLYYNSGSRTDHGEVETNGLAFADLREVPLTSAIFRVPADATDLTLPADEAALKPYMFADGTRNAFDLKFAPNGDLIAVDNGPDADFPDELNWIREGQHYGFPWRFGVQDNPQQSPDYDPNNDHRLSTDFVAVKNGTYRNDPGFPKPPAPKFADPIVNLGPDAAQYRGDDGQQHDAGAEGKGLNTFTPHRSPLGLAFVTSDKMPADLRGDGAALAAFLTSWGAAGGTLQDKGQDLLYLRLRKTGDNYETTTTQIARGFKNPIDTLLVDNKLYVLEFGDAGSIWELTFE